MKNIFFGLLLSSSVATLAQQKIVRCYTPEVIDHHNHLHTGYKQQVNNLFDAKNQVAKSSSRSANDTVYTIRVVFHVVYTTAAENIPDSFIHSQIEVLNEDYRRKNTDTNLTRTIFKPVATDTKIQFELATEDPDGNPTTGITRTVGNPGFLGYTPFTDNVKSNVEGKDPWPTDRYLNIWVCNIFNGFGILGYAFPPSVAPNWPANSATDSSKQGVVLHYPVVGRNNTAPIDPTVTKGRSAVHEIGHYLGLRHIWGDGGCSEDDGFTDTPSDTAASQQTCDYNENSCVDAPVDFPDQIENFMDYSDDRCLNMFSKQQSDLMRQMLATARPGIISGRSVEAPLSINEDKMLSENITVYPSPASQTLTIVHSQQNEFTYVLFDLTGKKMLTGESTPHATTKVDLSNVTKGLYFIEIKAGTKYTIKKVQVLK